MQKSNIDNGVARANTTLSHVPEYFYGITLDY